MFNKISSWWSGGSKKRALLVGGTFLVVGIAAASLFYSSSRLIAPGDVFTRDTRDLFEGFTRLVLSEANAQDNFALHPVASDSLGVEPTSAYLLTSKEDIKTTDVGESIRVTPQVKFSLAKRAEKEWLLTLAEPLSPNTLFKVALAASYQDEGGEDQTRDYEWAFQVKDSFKALHSIPRDAATGVPLNSGIEVTFSHDNFAGYEQFFTITPQVAGKFEKHGRTLVFVPEALNSTQVYTVTVKKGFSLQGSNEVLGEDYSFAFETQTSSGPRSPDAPWFRIYQKLQDVGTTEPPLIQLSARNMKENTVEVAVYPLNGEDEYLQMLDRRDQLPWWAYSKDYYLDDTSSRKALTSFQAPIQEEENVQFVRFAGSLPPGYYVAELKSGGLRDQVWIQVTDAAAYVNVAKNQTVVWATDLAARRPVAGARVELIGTGKVFSANGQGVAVFATPEELVNASSRTQERTRYYFKVSFADKELIIPAAYLSRSEGYWSDSGAVDYWKYLYTDRPLYQPTDTIKFWGLLKRRDQSKVSEPAILTLYKDGYVDYYYRPVVVATQTLSLDSLGTFTGEIPIKDLRADSYSLELKVGDEVIEQKYIQIRPYDKPAYQLNLVPDKKVAYAGNAIALEAQASFFEGTAVPDLSLVFETPEGKKTVVTDAEGKVKLTYTKDYHECKNVYRCWPEYAWLKISPELSEVAEIEASANLSFYGPEVYAASNVTYPAKGRSKVEVAVSSIDLDKVEDGYWYPDDDAVRAPSAGTKVTGEVIKITYTRTEVGTGYDFINKRTYKRYSYSRHEEKVDSFSGVTDDKGIFVYERNVDPDTSYQVNVNYYDARGRYDRIASYLYYYDGMNLNRYSGADYNYYHLKLPEDKTFSVGAQVAVDFSNNDESLPDNGNNYYLFLQYQNGFQEYASSQNSEYAFPFEARDIPNVNLSGVYFNGETFIVAGTGWVGNSIQFDTDDKTLQIEIVPDKDRYAPGEEVGLKVATRDARGEPVSAAVNLNLIDEAFYAVMDSKATPIDSIYEGMWSGSVYSASSHRRPENLYGGAEKGGCFLAGTKILMADQSLKNIEEVKVGDEILTLEDPRTNKKVSSAVTELYYHVISHYLVINHELKVTPEHLVYANLGFIPAGDLKEGDWMLKEDGEHVFVASLEAVREVVPVYNLKAEPQHTYFADGYFVHNEKGGGPREFFADAALFETVTTDSRGQARTSFILPDNITSWRVTAQGLSSRLDVGVSMSKIPVSLPVFIEATIGKEYLAGDEPVARLRSFGDSLMRGDPVTLSLTAPELGIADPQVKQSHAFATEFFPLPQLARGTYAVTYSLDAASKGKDAVKLPLEAVGSRVVVQSVQTQDATEGLALSNAARSPMAVIFSDTQRSAVYRTLQWLSSSWGDRIDQGIARMMAPKLLNETFGVSRRVPEFAASQYQLSSGGLALLPYSSADLELSARVADLHVAGFDDTALTQYFFRKLEDKKSNKEEVTLALYGLAALEQPVLPRLRAWIERDDLTVRERLYAALAAFALGDGESARAIYINIVDQYGQIKEPHIIIKAGDSDDEILNNTALTAVLASYLNEPQQYGLWGYLRFNHPKEILLYLEELNFVKANMARLANKPASVEFQVNQDTVTAELARPRFTYAFEIQPGDALKVIKSAPDIVITTNTPLPLAESGLATDADISIRREYYVNGQKTTTFKENNLVEVRLMPEFQKNALDGNYQITDILPSGLLPVTKLYRGGGSYDCHYWYPYNREGQLVKYMVNKKWRDSYCGGSYIKYYARVKTKGAYLAEPAVIQSMLNPDFMNYSGEVKVKIE